MAAMSQARIDFLRRAFFGTDTGQPGQETTPLADRRVRPRAREWRCVVVLATWRREVRGHLGDTSVCKSDCIWNPGPDHQRYGSLERAGRKPRAWGLARRGSACVHRHV